MTLDSTKEHKRIHKLIAGFFSGSMITILTQPLEVIKTNIVVNPLNHPLIETTGQIKSLMLSSKIIWSYNDGGWKNFFRGSGIACLRQSFGFGLYSFFTTEFIILSKKIAPEYNKYLMYSFSAATAKILALLTTTPLVLLKTRQEILTYQNSLISIARNVMIRDSFKGFFKGTSSLFYRETIYSLLHYGLYRYLQDNISRKETWIEKLIPAISAGVIALLVSHPFEVIRNRIQSDDSVLDDAKRYKNVRHAIKKIHKIEGIKGFFRGLVPRLLRRPLNSGVTWMTYDLILNSKIVERF